MKVSCLIPAAGFGERFKRSCPGQPRKLDLLLGGKTLLERTLEPFLASRQVAEIVLAVPPGKVGRFRKRFSGLKGKTLKVVPGGKLRTDSVWNALRASSPKIPWVIVHDAARPLLDPKILGSFLVRLAKKKALIVARPVHPTLKYGPEGRILRTVPREGLWEAETPQGFRRDILGKAYRNYFKKPFPATDEASLVEAVGVPTFLFKNTAPNPKITEFSDYQLAEKMTRSAPKVGIGFDIHRLVPGRALWLGGLKIPHTKGTLGHSDGDPILHAVSDALLGALALGDIGEYFSDRSPKTKNMKSSKILSQVYGLVREKGYELVHADINVMIEKPRLESFKQKIRGRVARILKLPMDRISLKARTAEGLGPIGEGNAAAAQAIVVLEKL
jgi:2-C-methyl-D-erythritol 4-phosphate cytidylyltransferase/2-C-methyl-D-erythritol 2,4-cyclodiphosphate synthase